MKTNKSNLPVNKIIALIVSIVLFTHITTFSQNVKNKFGIGFSSTVGGCGYGTMYNPSIHFYNGPFKMELSATIQKRKMNMVGAQFTFEYAIFDGCNRAADKLAFQGYQLFMFTATNYNQGAYLGNKQLKLEKRVAGDASLNFEALRYNSLDATVGFGSRIQLSKKVKWINTIGFSGWQTFKGEKSTYREYASFALKLRSGLTYDF